MRFSLINVSKQVGNLVDGIWLQDHLGTLDSACVKARNTEAANGNHITVAVVEFLTSTFEPYIDLTRLDRQCLIPS